MTNKLKNFFEKLEKENPYDYFLLKKLYYNPSSIFSDSKKCVDANFYYEEDAAYKYIFNNNLLEFLELAYYDDKFLDRINYYIILSLEDLFNKAEEIAYLIRENGFGFDDIFNFIKSIKGNIKLYKDKNIVKRIKDYDLELSEKISQKTADLIYSYETIDNKENLENNDNNNIIKFPRIK